MPSQPPAHSPRPATADPPANASSPLASSPRAVTLRSLLVGTVGVVLLCGLAPYNDYLIVNTSLIGSYLPLVVVLALLFLVVVVNAPLSRFAPRQALSAREMAVVLAMLLAASAIPTQGLLRFWLPMLVAPFHLGQEDPIFWQIFSGITLPSWVFPITDIAHGRNDPVMMLFYSRVQPGEAIPYAAWIPSLLGWGVFIAAWMTAMLALAMIVVPQWTNNERLPFPLGQIQAAIIEPPPRGRWFNQLFADPLFWIALGAVFAIHNINALSPHFPNHVPEIPLSYNLSGIFSERPWVYLGGGIKSATIYFTFIGLTYFVRARVAFSLWATFLLVDLYNVQLRNFGTELPRPATEYQHLGASLVFVGGMLWIGRRHFIRVIGDLLHFRSPGDVRTASTDGSYRLPALAFVLACGVMFTWLVVVGMQIWVATAIVGLILLAQLVITRFVAETGVPFFRFYGSHTHLFALAPAGTVTVKDAVIAGLTAPMGALSTRESLMPMAAHALRVEEEISPQQPRYRAIIAVMGWALVVGMVVGCYSSLRMYYTHATPLTSMGPQVINPQGLGDRPQLDLADPVKRVAQTATTELSYSPLGHLSIGMGIAALLQVLTLRYTAWPLMPVGYVACFTWYMGEAWYSLMIGWALKTLLLRFGGASLFQWGRPLFIGLIFGEALAAATWLLVNFLLALGGHDYFPVHILPS